MLNDAVRYSQVEMSHPFWLKRRIDLAEVVSATWDSFWGQVASTAAFEV